MASKIEWTDETWNPVTGCQKVSQGCRNCYAERIAMRLKRDGQPRYRNGFKTTIHDDLLQKPLEWKRKPRKIFVCSMSDLFQEEVPESFIGEVFEVMKRARQHTFMVLTKRAQRMSQWGSPWPNNVWAGVSVEADRYAARIDFLRRIQAKVKFVSFEPLLSEITDLDMSGIDWVIVGGEQAPKEPRKMETEWAEQIQAACKLQGVPFFFKQWGSAHGLLGNQDRQIRGQVCEDAPLPAGSQPSLF